MSSGPSNRLFAQRQKLIAPASVLVIWVIQLLFLAIFLSLVRSSFQERIIEDLKQDLKQFVTSNESLFHGPDLYRSIEDDSALSGLGFVRIVRGGDHIYFSASSDESFDLHILTRLDPHRQGCWLDLDQTAGNKDS
ncbi:MAG: hypothetical protein P8X39_11235, partial [Desulfofustis sp.]